MTSMKNLILVLFLGGIGHAKAEDLKEVYLQYYLKSDSLDVNLNDQQSKYTFEFTTIDGSSNQMIYSIDGAEKRGTLTGHSMDVVTTPGKHIFQFYYTENYFEVYTDSIAISNQHHATYEVQMARAEIMIIADKPVIYLYPQAETEVELRLNIHGKSSFYYPAYENGWKFSASPSGELTFGDKTYNYLFWEAEISRTFSTEELTSGFQVEKENVVSFLEEKLDLAGFNSKEKADFITYWGPRLAANDLNFVRFEFNDEVNRYAKIEMNPQPTELYRIYMTWMPISEKRDLEAQTIERFNRDGFAVLEWGGSELSEPNLSLNALPHHFHKN